MDVGSSARCVSHDVDDRTDSADPRGGYRRVEHWPIYPPDMQFEMGSGVAVDAKGVVYLFTRDIEHWAAHPLAMKEKMGKSSISMFDRDGRFLGKWGKSDERGFVLGFGSLFFNRGLVKENILLWNTHLMNLVLDDLMNQKNFLRKSFGTEGVLPSQINISRNYQKRAKEEREEITYPSPRSSSPMWLFTHSTQ